MAKYWVVNKNTKAFIVIADDSERPLPTIGTDQVLLLIPHGVAPANLKVQQNQSGGLELVADLVSKQGPLWDKMRAERNARLAACDWTMLADADLTTAEKNKWKAYRSSLRDLVENTSDPAAVVWPVKAE